MPNVNSVINDQIRRLARREIRANTRTVKKSTSQYRHAIAELRKQIATLTRRLAHVERRPVGTSGDGAAYSGPEDHSRFRAVGVKAHRAKLGLSAKEYGKLVGVSALTVYHWEQGKSRPRNKATAAKWLAVRGMGKKEAYEKLGMKDPAAGDGRGAGAGRGRPGRRRGKFKQTGEQAILTLLKGRKGMSTREINEAWRNEGRAGSADVMLGLLVKGKRLKRTKVEGQRGSQYSLS